MEQKNVYSACTLFQQHHNYFCQILFSCSCLNSELIENCCTQYSKIAAKIYYLSSVWLSESSIFDRNSMLKSKSQVTANKSSWQVLYEQCWPILGVDFMIPLPHLSSSLTLGHKSRTQWVWLFFDRLFFFLNIFCIRF